MRLARLTTDYVPTEDRLRLAGETAPGKSVVLWITRRLLERLLPHLFRWLDGQASGPRASIDPGFTELLQGMAQQNARSSLTAQPPVDAASADRSWLAESVDLTTAPSLVRLSFRSVDGGEPVVLDLDGNALRQWLQIVHDRYRLAEWPMSVWPGWITEAALPIAKERSLFH